jgi:hypothetical protein
MMLSDIVAHDQLKQTRANVIAEKMRTLTVRRNAGRITATDYSDGLRTLWRQAEDGGIEDYVDIALGNFER